MTKRKSTSHSPALQGEGDYRAAKRYQQAARGFVASHDVEGLARAAAPRSPGEARQLQRAETAGRARAKGKARSVASGRRAGSKA